MATLFPYLRLAVAISVLSLAGAAEKAVFAEPAKADERYLLEIFKLQPYRDGVLGLGPGLHFMEYDSKTTRPFPVAGIHHVISLEKAGESLLFLGIGHDGEFTLAGEEPGKDVRQIPLPPEVRKPGPVAPGGPVFPLLLASSGTKALTLKQTVWWLEGEVWKNRELPKVPKFYDEFDPVALVGSRYLLGRTLFIGWDRGEWGGMLVSIDLTAEDSQWVHLSGKKQGDDSGIPENQPVKKILSHDGESLWVATGLAHMGGDWSGLSRRGADGKWKHLINTEMDKVEGPLSLPPGTPLAAMTADAGGKVYVLGYGVGIFRVEEKSVVPVLNHDFGHIHEMSSHTVSCYPLDLATGQQGDFFVSTNAFGILAFRKHGDKWQARQILVAQE